MRYKTKNKIKYFLKATLKRFIRVFVLFGLLVSFTVSCFAAKQPYYYDTFSSFIYDGGDNTPSIYALISPYENPEDWEYVGYNSVTLAELDRGIIFTPYEDVEEFYSIKLEINGFENSGPAFTTANRGDVLIMEQYFKIIVRGIDNADFLPDVDNFKLELMTHAEGGTYSYYFEGSDYFKILKTTLDTDNDLVQYDIRLLIDDFTIPMNCWIGDYYYYFNGLSTEDVGTYRIYFYSPSKFANSPEGSGSILFYVGSYEDSPSYIAPDNDTFNDFSNSENELLNDTNADDEINSIFSGFNNVIDSLTDGFTILREMINPLLEWPPFSTLLYISLSLGIFGLIVNIGYSVYKKYGG